MKTVFKAVCRMNCKIEGHRRIQVMRVHGNTTTAAFEAVASRMRAKHPDLVEISGNVYRVQLTPLKAKGAKSPQLPS